MKIEASDKEIQDVFSQGYYQIPRFQRPFSWEKDEVENFWSDLIQDSSDNYFIGSMVVYQSKKPYFGIVDGQQRLTTITLILSSIRNTFISIGEENLAKGIHKYIEQPNIDNVNEFILSSESSFPYLQTHIQNYQGFEVKCDTGGEEKKLEEAFEIINDKIKSYLPKLDLLEKNNIQMDFFSDNKNEVVKKLKEIRDRVLSLKLVFIQLDSEEDAYLIFETLNARGRDLKTSDLVKNLLLKKNKSLNKTLDIAKEQWITIINKFDNINYASAIDTFLLHYWISEHSYTTEKKLFSEIKNYIDRELENSYKLLKNLDELSLIYCYMLNPSSSIIQDKDINSHLMALNLLKVKQQSPMVLSLLRAYKEKRISLKYLKICLKKIEFFHFVFNGITSQRSSGSVSTLYSSHAIELTKAANNNDAQKIMHSLFLSLERKIPSYEEFEINFISLSYLSTKTRDKHLIKYCLSKCIGSKAFGFDVDFDSMTLEHIIPEAKIKEGIQDIVVGSIGNLILIDAKTNSEELRDKKPEDKLICLDAKKYPFDKVFIDKNTLWDEQYVEVRAKKLAAYLYHFEKLI